MLFDAAERQNFVRRFAFQTNRISYIIAKKSLCLPCRRAAIKKIMKVVFSCLFTLLALVSSASPQGVKPTPTPSPADEDVVKISTNLIQVDVTVTDSKGKIVTDLKPEDFEIYENGEKQKISNFSFVSAAQQPAEPKEQKEQKITKDAIPLPSAALRPEKIRRTIALVVDDLSLSFESTYQVRRALKKFVDEQMQDGDLVAIIRTGAGIGALQQFTSDKRQLYAAIDKVKWNPIGNGKIGAFAPIEPTPKQQLKAMGAPVSDEDLQDEKNRINSQNDFQSSVFATGTLGALKYIVTGMSELPGRKSVILLSEGFRLMERDEQGFSGSGRVLDFLKQLVDAANRSSVVFYTIDARGLQTLGFTAQDQIIDTSAAAMEQSLSERRDELFETQSGLTYLAAETGGFAVLNNNDIAGGVRRVITDQSYYLIGYVPDSDTFDPAKRRFNKLEVKVNRKDVKVRYRSGFINVVDKNVAATPKTQTPVEQLRTALMSPFAVNGLSLRLNALFGNNEKDGSFVRSLIHVPAKELKFVDQPDGMKKAVFEVLAASFGDNGQVIDQIGRSYTLTAKDDMYRKLMEQGFVYHFTFPVKKPGAYQYRIAIRDAQGGAVGSASQFIEVPNLKKNQLTLSSIALESLSQEQWKQVSNPSGVPVGTNPMSDTALRQLKVGSIMRYGYEIYNARPSPSGKADLSLKVRVIHDGKIILDGQPRPIDAQVQKDIHHIATSAAISLGTEMAPGDYILQIIVTDNMAPEKNRVAAQYVQFEVIE
jgi:VWFA-related protein